MAVLENIKIWIGRLLKFAIPLILIGGGVYWFRFSPVTVESYPVTRGDIVAEVMGTGTLEARVQATISPKISGRINDVLVDQNERVSAGDLLVSLDDHELKQQVAIAEANVEAVNASIFRLSTDKERALAAYEQALKSHDRLKVLVREQAVSQDEMDKAIEALSVATTNVSHAEAAIAEGQRNLVTAQETLKYHVASLEDARIVAPFDGLIVRRDREPGDVVVPGSSVLLLISTEQLWIHAWIDETEMGRLQNQQSARIVFRSEPESTFKGSVFRLGREADRETREFIVDVDVLELPGNWAIGQRAEAFVEVARKSNVVVVPANRLLNRNDEHGVFVASGNVSSWRPVTIGLRNRESVEVVKGLDAGDVVVSPVNADIQLTDGRKIMVQQ